MKKLFFSISFILLYVTAFAQREMRPGYIITNSLDTINGTLDYRSDAMMSSQCRFTADGTDNIAEYKPGDIYGYRFLDGKYYISREVTVDSLKKNVFLEYLVNARVSFFYFRDVDGDHFYLQKEGNPVTELPYKEEVKWKVYEDDLSYIDRHKKSYVYRSKTHLGLIKYYMDDAPVLEPQIASLGKPGQQKFIKLAKEYQDITCKGTECLIYNKKLPPVELLIEAATGIMFIRGSDLDKNAYWINGVFFHVSAPNLNERVYLKIGASIADVTFEDERLRYYRFPVAFEYLFPKGRIRPHLGYGITFFTPSKEVGELQSITTVTLSSGAIIKLAERVGMTVNGDVEFGSFPVVPFIPVNVAGVYILSCGLYYRF